MPQIRMRDAGNVLRTITRIRMRDAGGVLRTIQRIRMRDAGNILRTVYQYLSVVLDKVYSFGSSSGASSTGLVVSDTVTGTVSGGTGPFTYLWEKESGHASITASTGTAISTTFTSPSVPEAGVSAIYHLKVTDSTGATSNSAPVIVELFWTNTT